MKEFDEDYKAKLLDLIDRSGRGDLGGITQMEGSMLFHWANHQSDPIYSFVPKRYRTDIAQTPKKRRRRRYFRRRGEDEE